MNILELNFERTWRGGERQTLFNMQGFRDKGIDVTLVCRKGYPLEQAALKDGFKVFGFDNVFGVIWFLITRGSGYSFLHAQTSHILTYCVFTKLFHGAKVIFTRRVDFVPKGLMTRIKYRLTDKVVAISIAVKDIIKRFSGKDVVVISDIVVPQILDKGRGIELLQSFNIQHKRIIGCVSALVPHKDPLTMVETIKMLAAERNDFVVLHFGTGDLEDIVKRAIAEKGLHDVYRLMGFCDNVEDFFGIFDVFVMSSEEEGLGSSVLDAFVYKVPVVGTDAGGLKDLLEDGRGLICSKKNAVCLAANINKVLNSSASAQDMVVQAYEYAIQNHSKERITDQYLQLMKR